MGIQKAAVKYQQLVKSSPSLWFKHSVSDLDTLAESTVKKNRFCFIVIVYLVSSYRPISLLFTIAKIFEKIVLARLQPIIEFKLLLPTLHFGFPGNHTTIEQVQHICSHYLATSRFGIKGSSTKYRRYCHRAYLYF